jgi:hypothetical protein
MFQPGQSPSTLQSRRGVTPTGPMVHVPPFAVLTRLIEGWTSAKRLESYIPKGIEPYQGAEKGDRIPSRLGSM